MEIKAKLVRTLQELTGLKEVDVSVPENLNFGDYSTNVAMVMAKKESLKPSDMAENLVSKLNENKEIRDLFEKIEVAGSGFINFYLKRQVLIKNLVEITASKQKYGSSKKGQGKTVIVDYSSPNIAKPFGIGHLRSTVIGQSLYNLYKFLGYETIGDNHLGDWGTQFGKLLYMIDQTKTHDFSIENLEKLYVEFHELASNPEKTEEMESAARSWFKKLEDEDTQARTIWKQCVAVSLNEFQKVYDLLGVKIDYAYGESFYLEEMKKLIDDSVIGQHLVAMGSPSKGWIIDLTQEGINTPLMFLKSDGATTYATRDLATIKFRSDKWKPDRIIYEVGMEQSLYFKQLFAAARVLNLIDEGAELVHIGHGLYLAPDGKKFSTRKGKTIKLEEVLNEAILRAKKFNDDPGLARKVGIGAIKYFDLMHAVNTDVIFDWDKIMNLEGNSGPYIQYAYARTQSVLKKAGEKDDRATKLDSDKKLEKEENELLRYLIHFPEVVEQAALSHSPNLLCNYVYNLSSRFNNFYNQYRIIESDNEGFRLILTTAVGQVIKNSLNLLDIEAPERM